MPKLLKGSLSEPLMSPETSSAFTQTPQEQKKTPHLTTEKWIMEHGYWSASASLMLSGKHIIKRRLSESTARGAFSRLKGVQVCCFKIQSSPSEICLLQGRETWSGTKLKSRFLRQQKPAPISPPVSVSVVWSMQPPAQTLEPQTWNSAAAIANF